MEHQYFARLDDAAADPAVRAIVVTGAGRAFCPGMDVAALEVTAAAGELVRVGRRPMHHALTIPKPMIAAINGACRGHRPHPGAVLRSALRGAWRSDVDVVHAPRARRRVRDVVDAPAARRRGTSPRSPPLGSDLRCRRSAPDGPRRSPVRTRRRAARRAGAYAAELARYASPQAMAAVRHQVYADLGDDFETSWVRTLAIMQRMNSLPDFVEGVASFVDAARSELRAAPPRVR